MTGRADAPRVAPCFQPNTWRVPSARPSSARWSGTGWHATGGSKRAVTFVQIVPVHR